MAKGIEKLRQNFYLDSDGECRWKYVELVEVSFAGVRAYTSQYGHSGLNLGVCHVCGKNPLIYNYILKYDGKELKNTNKDGYAIAGSECIESLSRVDMLRIEKDTREAKERHEKDNGMAFGTYLRDVFNPQHQEIWQMTWKYFDNVKNLGGSVKYFWEKCLSGVPLHEKTFGKELKQALKEKGLELPDMREIKKIINWNKQKEIKETLAENGPTREDYRSDEESIARAERAYETSADTTFYANGSMTDLERGIDDMNTEYAKSIQLMVPEGMELRDFYGISPITKKREPLYTELVDVKTGKTIIPDSESYLDGWDPVIEVITATDWNPDLERYEPADIMHIHLKKWFAQQNRPMQKKQETIKEIDPLLRALRAIAGDDNDHASTRNDVGFSGFDTGFAHSLASRDFLTERQVPYAKKLVWKYRKQLQEHFPEVWKEVEDRVKE